VHRAAAIVAYRRARTEGITAAMDITLELIDHATGEIFAQSEVPL
jgi:hypothetical protein